MELNLLPQKMKAFVLPLLVVVSSFSTLALGQESNGTSPEGHYRSQDQIVFNLKACQSVPCELQYKYAKIQVVSAYTPTSQGVSLDRNNSLTIISNLPIAGIQLSQFVTISTNAEKGVATLRGEFRQYGPANWQPVGKRSENVRRVIVSGSYGIATAIAVGAGSSVSITEDMKNASVPLISAYQGIVEHLAQFRQIIPRGSADERHLIRLEAQLKATLKLMVDEKGNPLLPVTHRYVTEGSRMIMVLSTVLEEIMSKYDFDMPLLEPLKPAKEALTQLSRQIRLAYGWEDGLAGSGSKALASLSTILDSELKSMYSIVALGNADAATTQAFNSLFRANSILFSKVNASNAGDIAGAGAAREVLAQWNSAAFQNILGTMMSAPKEAQAQFQYRILLAMTAVESMKDYVDPKGEANLSVNLPANVRSKMN